MKVNYILVTPDIAKEWLSKNTKNRPISSNHVDSYVDEMLKNNWKEETGEAIKITKSGHIADGQHRLQALIKANVCLKFTVFTELEEDVISVLDSGKRRNGSDILHINGVKKPGLVSGIIASSNAFKKGLYSNTDGGASVAQRLTNQQILETYQQDPEYWDEIGNAAKRYYTGFSKIISAAMVGGLSVILGSISKEKSDEFLDQLCYGLPVHSETINILRNKLIQDMTSLKKMTPPHKINLIIKTWNFYRIGKEAKVLCYDPGKEGKIRPI